MKIRVGLLLVALSVATPLQAGIIANSIAEFSGVQGQDAWSYGIFNAGAAPGIAFNPGAFEELSFNPANDRWEASDSLVGAQNNEFLNLDATGGHPTGIGPGGQDSIIWAVRRYVSEAAGDFVINIDLRKLNIGNNGGGGITGRVFVDGLEIFSQFVANADGSGFQLSLSQTLAVGTLVDFAIDPTGIAPIAGTDDPQSARADGSHFSAVISTTSEPAALGLALIGFLSVISIRVKRHLG